MIAAASHASAVSRRTRRVLVRRGAAVAAGLFLAACATRSSEGGAASAGPISLTYWHVAVPPDVAIPAFQQMAREYQAKHPNVQIVLEVLTGSTADQEQKLIVAAASNTVPDVTHVHPIFNASVAVKGVTAPLEPYLAKDRGPIDLKDFYPGAIDYFRWDGTLYALPNYSGPGVFYYNKNLLQKLALADPWDLFRRGQWTIEKMDEYVSKLTSGQGESKVFGRHDISRTIRVQYPWIQGFGGEVWNTNVTQTLLHEASAVKAWQYLADQLIRGYAPGADDLRGVSDGTRGLFNSGRIAFYFGIRSEVSLFKVPFGTVPIHKMANGKEYNRDGPNGVSVTQSGRHRDAAWQFLTFAVTRGVEINVALGITAPTTHSLAKQPAWLDTLIGGENAAAYDAAASQVKAIPHPPGLTEIDKLIQDAYLKVVNGQATAGAAMLAIKPQVDAILAGSRK